MDNIQIVFLSVIEGLTEFLPVSSTFHLIFAQIVMGIPQTPFTKLFDVFIQGGAILAVVVLYFHDFFKNRNQLLKIVFSFLPTALVGFLLYRVIKDTLFESVPLLLTVFVLTGFAFVYVERKLKKNQVHLVKEIKDLTFFDAILIGFIQSLAVIPGVSRAGAVILGMILMRYKRKDATKYSFLISVPTILAASVYDLYKSRDALMTDGYPIILALGFVLSFISAFIVIRWFIHFVTHHTLEPFGWYRVIIGILLAGYLAYFF